MNQRYIQISRKIGLVYITAIFAASNAWLISEYYRQQKYDNRLWDTMSYSGMIFLFAANYQGAKTVLKSSQNSNNRPLTRREKAIKSLVIIYRLFAIMASVEKNMQLLSQSNGLSYTVAAATGCFLLPTEIIFYLNITNKYDTDGKIHDCIRFLLTIFFGIALSSLYTNSLLQNMSNMDKNSTAQKHLTAITSFILRGDYLSSQHFVAIIAFLIIFLGGVFGYSRIVINSAYSNHIACKIMIYISCATSAAITVCSTENTLKNIAQGQMGLTFLLISVFAANAVVTSRFYTPAPARNAAPPEQEQDRTPDHLQQARVRI